MNRAIRTALTIATAMVATSHMAARQDVALKDLMPKGMLIGVAINQRQSDGIDATAVDIITKQFNQISPENLLKFQLVHPAADRYAFEAQDRYVEFGVSRKMQVIGHNLVWHNQTPAWVFQAADGKPADRETLLTRMPEFLECRNGKVWPNDRPGLGISVDEKQLTFIEAMTEAAPGPTQRRPDGSLTHW